VGNRVGQVERRCLTGAEDGHVVGQTSGERAAPEAAVVAV
jgi:hypothetical protein